METFRALREARDEEYCKRINSYLKSVKEKGVKVVDAYYTSDCGDYYGTINMRPFLSEKVEFEFGGSREYFNVWYHEMGCVRLSAEDFVEDYNALDILKDAVRKYVDENDIKGQETIKSDVSDHSWLLNNNGWM